MIYTTKKSIKQEESDGKLHLLAIGTRGPRRRMTRGLLSGHPCHDVRGAGVGLETVRPPAPGGVRARACFCRDRSGRHGCRVPGRVAICGPYRLSRCPGRSAARLQDEAWQAAGNEAQVASNSSSMDITNGEAAAPTERKRI